MNIFITDPCPLQSASSLDDRRVHKMVIECGQMLSAVVHRYHPQSELSEGFYKLTQEGHELILWTGNSTENFAWLMFHMEKLGGIYSTLHGKEHGTITKLRTPLRNFFATTSLDSYLRTPFVNAASDLSRGLNFRGEKEVTNAYQLYLAAKWKLEVDSGYIPRFKGRTPPLWLKFLDPELYSVMDGERVP